MNAAFAGALALQIRRTDPLWGKLEDFAIAFRRWRANSGRKTKPPPEGAAVSATTRSD